MSKGSDEKYCLDCANIIKINTEICPNCGCRQLPPPTVFGTNTANGKNRVAAALFAFFLGAFGIHRFYLGRTISGIIYLLFFWTLIPAIIAFVECILLLCMSDREFAIKYGTS